MIRSGGGFYMSGCMRKDETGIWMMKVETECRVMVIAETEDYDKKESELVGIELETVFVLHCS